jgi:ribonucleoside-diphosphate reductase alpha chain
LHAFNNNLWLACDTLMGFGIQLDESNSDQLLMRDWVRRGVKFANNHFGGDLQKMCNALKDVSNLHRWESINRGLTHVDFAGSLKEKKFTAVDTMGAQACAGGVCELAV